MKIGSVDFNEKVAQGLSEEDFVKAHEHHKDDVDLHEAYVKLTAKGDGDKLDEKPKAKAK